MSSRHNSHDCKSAGVPEGFVPSITITIHGFHVLPFLQIENYLVETLSRSQNNIKIASRDFIDLCSPNIAAVE